MNALVRIVILCALAVMAMSHVSWATELVKLVEKAWKSKTPEFTGTHPSAVSPFGDRTEFFPTEWLKPSARNLPESHFFLWKTPGKENEYEAPFLDNVVFLDFGLAEIPRSYSKIDPDLRNVFFTQARIKHLDTFVYFYTEIYEVENGFSKITVNEIKISFPTFVFGDRSEQNIRKYWPKSDYLGPWIEANNVTYYGYYIFYDVLKEAAARKAFLDIAARNKLKHQREVEKTIFGSGLATAVNDWITQDCGRLGQLLTGLRMPSPYNSRGGRCYVAIAGAEIALGVGAVSDLQCKKQGSTNYECSLTMHPSCRSSSAFGSSFPSHMDPVCGPLRNQSFLLKGLFSRSSDDTFRALRLDRVD